MLAMPALWWLRPVRSAARVGEHSAVVWNWLYRSPLLATRSRFGVGIGPPKVLGAPKPVSSVMMRRTFGAPLGAVTSLGKSGLDSLALRPMTPPNGASGTGRTGEPPVGDFWVDWSCAWAGAGNPPEAANPTSRELIVSIAVANVVRTRIVSSEDGLTLRAGRTLAGRKARTFRRVGATVAVCWILNAGRPGLCLPLRGGNPGHQERQRPRSDALHQ